MLAPAATGSCSSESKQTSAQQASGDSKDSDSSDDDHDDEEAGTALLLQDNQRGLRGDCKSFICAFAN